MFLRIEHGASSHEKEEQNKFDAIRLFAMQGIRK